MPKLGDQTDDALASFINTYPEKNKMKIMFLRESEGVYKFGSRKVHIKIEKGNQVLVRVGGGYMHVEDFINQYTDQETEKILKIDALSKFQNKAKL